MTLADIAPDDAAYAAARAAFEEHSRPVLRGQIVTDELELAFSRRCRRNVGGWSGGMIDDLTAAATQQRQATCSRAPSLSGFG